MILISFLYAVEAQVLQPINQKLLGNLYCIVLSAREIVSLSYNCSPEHNLYLILNRFHLLLNKIFLKLPLKLVHAAYISKMAYDKPAEPTNSHTLSFDLQLSWLCWALSAVTEFVKFHNTTNCMSCTILIWIRWPFYASNAQCQHERGGGGQRWMCACGCVSSFQLSH